MANLKTKKTAAGAQQYSAPGKASALAENINKDIWRYFDKKITAKEFKDKYGVSIAKAQTMAYGAEAVEKKRDSFEKKMARESKAIGMSKGGMTKKRGYKSGGLACGASTQPARPLKKGK